MSQLGDKALFDMDPKIYEQIVCDLATRLQSFFGKDPTYTVQYGGSSRVKGISGIKHQIDVVVSDEAMTFLIECKCWNHTVDLPTFLTFFGRMTEIRPTMTNHRLIGVVATTIGFDSGAKHMADYYGIEMWHVTGFDDFILRWEKTA